MWDNWEDTADYITIASEAAIDEALQQVVMCELDKQSGG